MIVGPTDPVEVLAFIDGYSSMPSGQWRSRFPEWCKLVDSARHRFNRELHAYRAKWGPYARGSSDPGVDSIDGAMHKWVFLPLIRDTLKCQLIEFAQGKSA